MLARLMPFVLIAAAGYWYWSGPYNRGREPTYAEKLEENFLNVSRCLRGRAYAEGATGEVAGDPEVACAQQYNLYMFEGQWHSYDDVRPDGGTEP